MERGHDDGSTIFCTKYHKEDWHGRLGGGVHVDAIMDRIVRNDVWGKIEFFWYGSKTRTGTIEVKLLNNSN